MRQPVSTLQTANFNIFSRPLLIFACLYPHIWKSGATIFCTPTLKSAAAPLCRRPCRAWGSRPLSCRVHSNSSLAWQLVHGIRRRKTRQRHVTKSQEESGACLRKDFQHVAGLNILYHLSGQRGNFSLFQRVSLHKVCIFKSSLCNN